MYVFFFVKVSILAFLTLFLLSSAFTQSLYVSAVFVSLSDSFVKSFCQGKPCLSCTSVGKEK